MGELVKMLVTAALVILAVAVVGAVATCAALAGTISVEFCGWLIPSLTKAVTSAQGAVGTVLDAVGRLFGR